jgi:hypothetical protein
MQARRGLRCQITFRSLRDIVSVIAYRSYLAWVYGASCGGNAAQHQQLSKPALCAVNGLTTPSIADTCGCRLQQSTRPKMQLSGRQRRNLLDVENQCLAYTLHVQ